MGKHLGSSMRPPFVPLVYRLQHIEEHCPHVFEGDNVLASKMVKQVPIWTFSFQHYWCVPEGWPVDFSFTGYLTI